MQNPSRIITKMSKPNTDWKNVHAKALVKIEVVAPYCLIVRQKQELFRVPLYAVKEKHPFEAGESRILNIAEHVVNELQIQTID